MIELGISTFGETTEIEGTGITPAHDERIRNMIEEMKLADEVGLDLYAIGEHHREDFAVSAPEILLAAGERISGKNYYPKLYSIECRINAENPYAEFRPAPGKITQLNIPGGHGVRVDTHVYAGYSIPPNYDSMIAKLIITAQSRKEAIAKMKRALDEFYIEGVKTTIPFHRQLMDNPDFLTGNYTTKFMESFVMDESYEHI